MKKSNNNGSNFSQGNPTETELSRLSRQSLDILRDLEWLERDPAQPKVLFQKRAEYERISDQIRQLVKARHPSTNSPVLSMSSGLAGTQRSSEIISATLSPPSLGLSDGTSVTLTDFLASKKIDLKGLSIKISSTHVAFSNTDIQDQAFRVDEIVNFSIKDQKQNTIT